MKDEIIIDGEHHKISELFKAGLKFTSQTFAAKGEIIKIEEKTIDVMLTETQGFSYIEKGWNKEHFITMLKNGTYIPILKPEAGPIIW